MSLDRRLLPVEEWPKLDATELGPVWRTFAPETTRVLVVEDGDQIVGTWALIQMLHAEGVWIAEPYRKRGSVARRLLHGMRELAQTAGATSVLTGSVDPEVSALLERVGATPLPGTVYVLPLVTDAGRGRAFHDQLVALVPEAAHAEDADHDRAVGAAMRIAVEEHDPARAEQVYNAWASAHAYAPVQFLGTHDGALAVDIQTAVITIDAGGQVAVLEHRCPQ